MVTKKFFFMDCHLAGRKYHDADEVWDELKVGTILRLERDKENRFDPYAVIEFHSVPPLTSSNLLSLGKASELALLSLSAAFLWQYSCSVWRFSSSERVCMMP